MGSKTCLIFALLIGFPAVSGIFGIGRLQSVGVKGKLCCEKVPAKNITVMLYDKELIYDSLMGQNQTNDEGSFKFQGSKREITSIEPYVQISHQCNVTKGCEETIRINIPYRYLFKGLKPKSYYKIKDLDLAKHSIRSKLKCRD